jgi:hypothetical protein
LVWECYAQHLTTQGQAIGEGGEGSAFANGGLCGVLGNGGANAKPLQIFPFTFLLLPWSLSSLNYSFLNSSRTSLVKISEGGLPARNFSIHL